VIKEKDVGLPPFGPDLSLISRLFSGFDFGFALTFCFPPIFSVTPRLRAESPPWWVSVVNIGVLVAAAPVPPICDHLCRSVAKFSFVRLALTGSSSYT